ncbi:unnamed protein product [Heligmosomoides polygyrus]|uniref:Uncharacterized protein n=1 Tax=Heligmosomoides polygyrus TaxID=6339 RepID=A0A183GWR7_HELPZ|nr:unnamed protein product [Heligmosomoides polygyrus]
MAELRAAVRTVKDRQQAFLTLVCSSCSPEVDNEAYANYMEDMKLEETLLSTEAVITTLRTRLEEVASLTKNQPGSGLDDVSTEQPPYNGDVTHAQILDSSEIARSKETKELQLAEQDNSYFTRTTIPSQNVEGTPTSQVRPSIRLGILQGLRKFEDFRTVLPILDLVKGKFPLEIQQKLHDLEFQAGTDFDLFQVMHHLDIIIVSREKYEDSTTLCHRDSNAGVSEVVTHAITVPIQSADDVEETTTKCYARIDHTEANLPRIEIAPGRARLEPAATIGTAPRGIATHRGAHLKIATTKRTITIEQNTPQLTTEDIDFIVERDIELPTCHSQCPVTPDILVGIDNY